MKNDARNDVFNRFASLCFSLFVAVVSAVVNADTGLPPPTVQQSINTNFPSGQALKAQGYDASRNVLRVDTVSKGTSTVSKSGDTITGKQSKTVTVTGTYGEKATATTSITQNVSSSKLQTGVGAFFLGSAINNASNAAAESASKMGDALKQGDYATAAYNAYGMVSQFLDGLVGSPIKGVFELVKSTIDGYKQASDPGVLKMGEVLRKSVDDFLAKQAQAEKNGDLAGALENAALKKALDAASKINVDLDDFTKAKLANATKNSSGNYVGLYLLKLTIHDDSWVSWVMPKQPNYDIYTLTNRSGSVGSKGISQLYLYSGHQVANQYYDGFSGYTVKQILTDADLNDAISKISTPSDVQIKQTVQAMPLTETDVNSILQKMLDSQETNHKQLMDQLGKLGNIIPDATTSKEWQPVVMTTDPYTPLGSNVAQQTQFVISSDGTVSSSTISRPDLPANSSFAPTRTLIQSSSPSAGTGTSTGTETPLESEQKPGCSENPNDASCFGNMDYQDLSLPEQTIDLDFEPLDIFQTNGVCPQPKTVNLGVFGNVEFSYQPACDFALMLRPVLIMITILTCAWFIYSALEDL